MDKALNQRYYSCFFTGHRILGDEDYRRRVYHAIYENSKKLIEQNGVDTFICGGAIGFDTLAARAVIRLKEIYPHIILKIYIPCYEHYKRWNNKDKFMWKYIMSFADSSEYITEDFYTDGCMQKRNIKMADDAHYCIAFCRKTASGTGATIRYAMTKSCSVNNLADIV